MQLISAAMSSPLVKELYDLILVFAGTKKLAILLGSVMLVGNSVKSWNVPWFVPGDEIGNRLELTSYCRAALVPLDPEKELLEIRVTRRVYVLAVAKDGAWKDTDALPTWIRTVKVKLPTITPPVREKP